MKRAALIGIISLAGLLSLWLLLAWLGKTESTYHQPRPGMRFEGKGDNDSAPETTAVYRPRHFTAGEVGHYQVRMEKGFLKMPLDCERAVHPLARISHRAKGFGLAQCGAAI